MHGVCTAKKKKTKKTEHQIFLFQKVEKWNIDFFFFQHVISRPRNHTSFTRLHEFSIIVRTWRTEGHQGSSEEQSFHEISVFVISSEESPVEAAIVHECVLKSTKKARENITYDTIVRKNCHSGWAYKKPIMHTVAFKSRILKYVLTHTRFQRFRKYIV